MTPGLYGKLPAHGDFVARGWEGPQVAALDAWLTSGLAAIRDGLDDDAFAARLTAAPLWRGYIPPGACGAAAMHLALAPSIDSAGRYFFIAGGVVGAAEPVWAVASQSPGFADAVEAATYNALGGSLDADSYAAAITGAMPIPDARGEFLAGVSLPPSSAWWVADPAEGDAIGLRAATVDAALLQRLVGGTA
ncbi:type VI secretion system-associated protein TagF [Polymorphobacter megasporae]|uniref:type VI secretion system-associated protein TagF n=1 Tax=Glacieibacterium megasporae TaxID=2835787 RepID=UPI001C1DEB85|nr:type VI secretion system-associated protein TagF [Polymorphobacter megasporae]UAJ09827.1 type VI secretion system-associated protein TagF [Polymorphobacter megasporae]